MINKRNLPSLVKVLTHNFDAWIVGGACVDENPKDYDLFIPLHNWEKVCSTLPTSSVSLTSLGGLRFTHEGVDYDLWTGSMENFVTSSLFKQAYHVKSDTFIKRSPHKLHVTDNGCIDPVEWKQLKKENFIFP